MDCNNTYFSGKLNDDRNDHLIHNSVTHLINLTRVNNYYLMTPILDSLFKLMNSNNGINKLDILASIIKYIRSTEYELLNNKEIDLQKEKLLIESIIKNEHGPITNIVRWNNISTEIDHINDIKKQIQSIIDQCN